MPIDFSLLDPDAFYKGAAHTNAFMQQMARQKAGSLIASGDRKGATDVLNQSGDIDAANAVQLNFDESDKRLQDMNATKRQESAQMIQDVASVLDGVRAKEGDQAVAPAFEQLVPLFKERGATDQELDTYRQGLQKDPGHFLQTVHQLATEHLKTFKLGPGETQYKENGEVVASQPDNKVVGPGASLVQVPTAPSPVVSTGGTDLPPEAKAALKPGHVTKFANGQAWTIGVDGNPTRVQ